MKEFRSRFVFCSFAFLRSLKSGRGVRVAVLLMMAALLGASSAFSVDPTKFMNCHQSAVCRRYTAFVKFQEEYAHTFSDPLFTVDPHSVDPPDAGRNGNVASAKLRNTVDGSELGLQILITREGITRVTIDEMSNTKDTLRYSRYKVVADDIVMETTLKDAARASVEVTAWFSNNAAKNGTFSASGPSLFMGVKGANGRENAVLVLQYSPFQLQLYVNGHLAQIINERQLMNFERYRPPPSELSTEAPQVEPTNDASADDGKPQASSAPSAASPSPDTATFTVSNQGVTGAETTDASPAETPSAAAPVQPVRDAVELDSSETWSSHFGGSIDQKKRGPSAVGLDVHFADAYNIYGLPEHAVSFNLPVDGSEPYRSWNLDVFEYALHSPMALYGTVPFLFSVHTPSNNSDAAFSTGFLWLNPSESWINLRRERGATAGFADATGSSGTRSWFVSETGVMDFLLFTGPFPQDVLAQYHIAFGLPAVAPLFSIGKHQCRWNYIDEKDIAAVDAGFDEHQIPYDVIWLDIEHTDGRRYFTWHPDHFRHPKEMLASLAKSGRKLVAIVDPHIKKDSQYPVYAALKRNGAFLQQISSGKNNVEDFEAWCWPGDSLYPDFLCPKVRELFKTFYQPKMWLGSGDNLFVWNDMNEPSVFNKPEVTCPRDVLHLDGREHREVHNLYGHYFLRTTYEGLLQRNPNQRPFVLTRAFFAGSHRYGAVWTGDNTARWDHLKIAIPMLLNLAIAGLSFVGADVGGFFGNPEPELLVRWSQQGAWYPFYRDHSHIETKRREPWLFDSSVLRPIREAVEMRYRFLAYWYTAFMEYAYLGQPIIRPLWWSGRKEMLLPLFADSALKRHQEDHFRIGDHLLVRSIADPMVVLRNASLATGEREHPSSTENEDAAVVTVCLPLAPSRSLWAWQWFDVHTGLPVISKSPLTQAAVTLERIPVYAEAGSIIPIKNRVRRASALQLGDPFTLHVYLGVIPETQNATWRLEAEGKVFVDDGASYDAVNRRLHAFVYDRLRVSGTLRENNVHLSSAPAPIPFDPAADHRSTSALEKKGIHLGVEKVVFFGVPQKPASVVVVKGDQKEKPCVFYVDRLTATQAQEGTFRVEVKRPEGLFLGHHNWSLRILF